LLEKQRTIGETPINLVIAINTEEDLVLPGLFPYRLESVSYAKRAKQ